MYDLRAHSALKQRVWIKRHQKRKMAGRAGKRGARGAGKTPAATARGALSSTLRNGNVT
jgi:hypothetical protein